MLTGQAGLVALQGTGDLASLWYREVGSCHRLYTALWQSQGKTQQPCMQPEARVNQPKLFYISSLCMQASPHKASIFLSFFTMSNMHELILANGETESLHLSIQWHSPQVHYSIHATWPLYSLQDSGTVGGIY